MRLLSAALAAASLYAAISLLVACAGAARAPSLSARPVRVLVYNIHAGKDAAGADNLERVAGMVRDSAADLVLLQEVDSATERSGRVDQVAELRRLTGYHGAFGNALAFQGGGYGIAILSRWPIVRDTLFRLPVAPAQERAGGSYEPRGALYATVARGRDTLHVVNTHLDPSGDDGYRRQEAAAIVGILSRAARSADAGNATLFGGDLNSTPESAIHATFASTALRDAWEGCGVGDAFTYPETRPVKRIDYLWVSAGVRCASARVLASTISDHRPVLFTLEIPTRR